MNADKEKYKECMETIKKLTPEELEAYIQTNYRIKERVQYGMHSEPIEEPEKTTICTWFNGSRRWFCKSFKKTLWYESGKKNIPLDANVIITPYPYRIIKKFEECLQPLPLYYCSAEAKMRGEVDPVEAIFCWALKQLERLEQKKYEQD